MPRSDALTRFADWFDARTSYRAGLAMLAARRVRWRASWSQATGACTLGMFAVVGVTGAALMTAYSPASDHGWSSVRFIESTPSGSFLRGLHYWSSHALLILFAVHLARLILTASFRAPRDLAWVSGVLLLPLLAAAAVTGNPLTASNKAVGQIGVESHIVGAAPVVGPFLRRTLVGGDDVGHLTLTHLYALHVCLLPLFAGVVLALHVYQQVRWGTVAPPEPEGGTTGDAARRLTPAARLDGTGTPYWPDQTARNAVVFAAVFGVTAWLAWRYPAPLDAPADPTLPDMPRPEWYFRGLFELRNSFNGPLEFVATGLLPGACLAFLVLLPWVDARLPRRAAVAFRYAVVLLAAGGWAGLTAVSFARDREDPKYREYLVRAEETASRAAALASIRGIPADGPARLLQTDPKTQGPVLFERHCATCHSHLDAQGNGIAAKKNAAPNLYGFAGRGWVAGLLDPEKVAGPEYFGHTAFADGDMVAYVRDTLFDVEDKAARKEQVRKAVLALSAEAELPAQQSVDRDAAAVIAEGRELITGELACTDCHKFRDAGELGTGPDLTGYGSRNWLAEFVANPAHERFYGENNEGMPAFAAVPEPSPENLLSREQLLLVVDWLRGDWPEPAATQRDASSRRVDLHRP